ncbi:MAG: hypothetical protein IPH64_19045 [Comamonadaceae bacterium]|nr:hypothetical protein [Comamonadaceae bacterium]
MLSPAPPRPPSYRLRRSVHGHHLYRRGRRRLALALAGEGRAARCWAPGWTLAPTTSARRSIPRIELTRAPAAGHWPASG